MQERKRHTPASSPINASGLLPWLAGNSTPRNANSRPKLRSSQSHQRLFTSPSLLSPFVLLSTPPLRVACVSSLFYRHSPVAVTHCTFFSPSPSSTWCRAHFGWRNLTKRTRHPLIIFPRSHSITQLHFSQKLHRTSLNHNQDTHKPAWSAPPWPTLTSFGIAMPGTNQQWTLKTC